MPDDSSTEEWKTAVHEVAHAVVASAIGRPVRGIWLSGGFGQAIAEPPPAQLLPSYCSEVLPFWLAGYVAEALYLNAHSRDFRTVWALTVPALDPALADGDDLVRALGFACGSLPAWRPDEPRGPDSGIRMLADPAMFEAGTAVLQEAWEVTVAFLDQAEVRAEIEALARKLVERRRLTAAEIAPHCQGLGLRFSASAAVITP